MIVSVADPPPVDVVGSLPAIDVVLRGRRTMTVGQFRNARGLSGKVGPNGRKLCGWCTTEIPPRRQSWCSSDCAEQFALALNPGYLRSKVGQRDHGVCALCAVDTCALKAELVDAARAEVDMRFPDRAWDAPGLSWVSKYLAPQTYARIVALGIPASRWSGDWWDADHVVPVVDNGTSSLDNMRTLCVPCHRAQTTELARRPRQSRWSSESFDEPVGLAVVDASSR